MLAAAGMVLASGLAGHAQNAADAPTQPAPAESDTYVSLFVSDPAFGKDPFFPASPRRTLEAVQTTAVVTNVPVEASLDELFALLKIKGISFPSSGPLVLINHYTFAEGEELTVKIGGRAFPVRCVTIKDRSAVLNIRGRTKEFSLREGL